MSKTKTKPSHQFYLNIRETEMVNDVVNTMKSTGALDEELSIGQIAKSLLLTFVKGMKKEVKEDDIEKEEEED